MAIDAKYRMSQERLDELKKELEHMQTVDEKEVAEQIKEARSFGDLSENSEYDEAKNAQAMLYSKIAEYKDLIENAVITEAAEVSANAVALRRFVTVREVGEEDTEKYQIVGSQEANPAEGRISEEAPFGRALLGHVPGDKVDYEAMDGVLHFEIIAVES